MQDLRAILVAEKSWAAVRRTGDRRWLESRLLRPTRGGSTEQKAAADKLQKLSGDDFDEAKSD